MISLTTIILTHNEELHIGRAICSAKSFSRDIIVIDSGSTDSTVSIARRLGALVLQNKWVNYATQFQWGLDNAPISTDWVMRLDADEFVSSELQESLIADLPSIDEGVAGIVVDLNYIFMGRRIKYGGRRLKLLRVFRYNRAKIESRWMDEHIVLFSGTVTSMYGTIFDNNIKGLTFFTNKHNGYSTREAIDIINQRYDIFSRTLPSSLNSGSKQASAKRWIKEKVYNRIPFQFSAAMYFFYRYILQLGFLDGKPGLIYHFLQGFWYRFLVGAKVYELNQEIKGLEDLAAIRRRLADFTGLKLD